MKIYTENFTILLNKHITNKEIDTYEFRVMCLQNAQRKGLTLPEQEAGQVADLNLTETV